MKHAKRDYWWVAAKLLQPKHIWRWRASAGVTDPPTRTPTAPPPHLAGTTATWSWPWTRTPRCRCPSWAAALWARCTLQTLSRRSPGRQADAATTTRCASGSLAQPSCSRLGRRPDRDLSPGTLIRVCCIFLKFEGTAARLPPPATLAPTLYFAQTPTACSALALSPL